MAQRQYFWLFAKYVGSEKRSRQLSKRLWLLDRVRVGIDGDYICLPTEEECQEVVVECEVPATITATGTPPPGTKAKLGCNIPWSTTAYDEARDGEGRCIESCEDTASDLTARGYTVVDKIYYAQIIYPVTNPHIMRWCGVYYE